jgi:hypothetical protein
MTRRRWWSVGMVGLLMMAGALGSCGGGDHDDGFHESGGCVLVRELEPNDTALTAQFLGDAFVGDCVDVAGNIFDAADEDTYRFLVQESLNLVVTLDHSPLVDFDIQLFNADTQRLIRDCGSNVVPEVCVVSFDVGAGDIAVDVVVTSFGGAGTYTLTLDAQ